MRLLKVLVIVIIVFAANAAHAQRFLMDMIDTTTDLGKGMLSMYQQYSSLRFTGYIQPQFQVASDRGVKSFNGGDFAPNSNSRFMLRRSRIRVDHAYYNKKHEIASYFVFQFDVTERGVAIRDVWGKVFENKWKLFSLNTGMMARPFSYELNLGSADRESPERGRMSQTLMKTERDLGASITFEPQKEDAQLKFLKIDAGVFNGQGPNGPTDFDSYKDYIGRIALKPTKTGPFVLTAAASVLYGTIGNQSPWLYETKNIGGVYTTVADSAPAHYNEALPRHYYGADIQLKHPDRRWATEVRAEYMTGLQTGTQTSSETPGVYPIAGTTYLGLYTRKFDGAYFYFLQNIFSKRHQLVAKYDWYDPNKLVSGNKISSAQGLGATDVRYNTFGFGYLFYANPHLRAMFWYEIVKNEHTNGLKGYTTDINDNVFTCRLQYRF